MCDSNEVSLLDASWIWASEETAGPDSYVCFRHRFTIDCPRDDAFVDISVDSDFVLWLNNGEIGRGQFSDFSRSKTWSRFSVGSYLHRGENVLAVLVFHRGEDFSDHQAGQGGMIFALQSGAEVVNSGKRSRVRLHPGFRSARRERMTQQCGFTFEYDARRDVDWITPAFDDSRWSPPLIVQARGVGKCWVELLQRPLPHSSVGEMQPVKVAMQGSIIRRRAAASPAASMASSALLAERPLAVFAGEDTASEIYDGPPKNLGEFLSPQSTLPLSIRPPEKNTSGRYVIFDLEEETVGFIEFKIAAQAGTVVDISHGEHLDDGRVRARIGDRNFADRYICREGIQHFQMPFRRVGARYIEMHVSRYTDFRIYMFSLRKVEYPTNLKGSFKSQDTAVNRIHHISVRTLRLCRHEHYEDCPWREQSLYAYDARLQALYGYYAFGDYRFPEVSFSLLGRTLNKEGLLALTAPSRNCVNIPIFSLTWVVSVAEHWMYCGERTLFEAYHDVLATILEKAFAQRDAKTGLYFPPEGPELWHFYEWTTGLCGRLGNDPLQGIHHAAYNLYLHEAGRAWAWMLLQAGRKSESKKLHVRLKALREAIHGAFWDSSAGIYRSILYPNGEREGAHELVQALALCENIPPPKPKRKVVLNVMNGNLVSCTLGTIYFLLRGMLNISPVSREWICFRLLDGWQKMVFSGATSVWETIAGASDFDYAGSLCHAWSALPVYFHQAVVLGIYPLDPGFRRFAINIWPSSHSEAEGTVPTPSGDIGVKWKKMENGLHVEVCGPRDCVPELIQFDEAPVFFASYNRSQLQ